MLLMESLGKRVRRMRDEKGWSQTELALEVRRVNRALTTRQSTIAAIEDGTSKKPTILYELAKALGTSEEWLKTGRDSSKETEPSSNVSPFDVAELVFETVKGSYQMLGLSKGEADELSQLLRELCEEPLTPSGSEDPLTARRILAESLTRKFLKSKHVQ